MKEWARKNYFNSFNSIKGLLYIKWYEAIVDWKKGFRKAPLAPVEVSLDLYRICSLKCSHCNASRYLEEAPKDEMIKIPDEALMKLIKFFADWGVKAICFGGGGESTLHPKIWDALEYSTSLGMENSIATNGIHFDDKSIDIAVKNCRWIGVSVDSAKSETYEKGRGVNRFNETINNLKKMAKRAKELNTNCDVSYKFLLFEYNQHEVYEACKLAKELGVKDFHARQADLTHQGMHTKYKGKATPYDIDLIKSQFEKCHELEDKDFHVYTIVHKFNPDFTPIKSFSQCYASPCCLQICPNGSLYLCPDSRYNEDYNLGSWYPEPKNILRIWGSKKHYDLVFKTGRKNCNSRCTFNPYNIQCEELFIKNHDPFCKNFI